jgi:hypothetical protein
MKTLVLFLALFVQSSSQGSNAIAGTPNCTGITATFVDCFVTPFFTLVTPWSSGGFTYGPVRTSGSGAFAFNAGTKSLASNAITNWAGNQTSQIVYSQTTGIGVGGPAVRIAGSGAYVWQLAAGAVYTLTSAGVMTSIGGGCPAATPGDVYSLTATGFNLTCLDVTTGVSAVINDPGSTFAAGRPGFVLDGDMKVTKWGGS